MTVFFQRNGKKNTESTNSSKLSSSPLFCSSDETQHCQNIPMIIHDYQIPFRNEATISWDDLPSIQYAEGDDSILSSTKKLPDFSKLGDFVYF